MKKRVHGIKDANDVYPVRFMKKILDLAREYDWKPKGYDELYSKLSLHLQASEEIEHIDRADCYGPLDQILRLGNTSSLVKALTEAMEDVPNEAIHTDEFNPDIDSYKMDFLFEKNMFYQMVFWSWDHNAIALRNFIEDLRSADKSPSRPTTASRLHPALCD